MINTQLTFELFIKHLYVPSTFTTVHTMSPVSAKLYEKQTHEGRNDSDEIDVFEAARYFSGAAEERTQLAVYNNNELVSQKAMSLDLLMENPIHPYCCRLEKQSKEKKSKHPSSPSRKWASFLNSLFTQTAKKKAKSVTQSIKDEDDSPGWRRRRRSSISQTHDISNTDVKSLHSYSSSGFKTPPPYSSTKIYKEFDSFASQKNVGWLTNCNGQPRSANLYSKNQRFRFNDGFLEKDRIYANGFLAKDGNYRNWGLEKDGGCRNGVLEKDGIWADEFSEDKSFRKDLELDDGGESDSSSDLFELQNYDLGVYSNDLPVYETTHLESIKRGPAITSGSS